MIDNRYPIQIELVGKKLSEQCQEDIRKIMSTREGRRFFSYMIMHCGLMDASLKGNSRDFFNAGRRSVAIDLIGSIDANGLRGVDLRHKAEKEYIMFQNATIEEFKIKKKGNS